MRLTSLFLIVVVSIGSLSLVTAAQELPTQSKLQSTPFGGLQRRLLSAAGAAAVAAPAPAPVDGDGDGGDDEPQPVNFDGSMCCNRCCANGEWWTDNGGSDPCHKDTTRSPCS